MPSDQTVTSADVLAALMDLKRRGATKILEEIEAFEPDLLGYALEELGAIHARLHEVVPRGKDAQHLYRRTQELLLVTTQALRRAHARLWESGVTPDESCPPDPAPPAQGGAGPNASPVNPV